MAQVDTLQPIETAEALLSTKDLDIIRPGLKVSLMGTLNIGLIRARPAANDCNRHIVSGFAIILARHRPGAALCRPP